jgi:hypothetical protein
MKLLIFLIAVLNIATATWLIGTQMRSNRVSGWEAMVAHVHDETPRNATMSDLRTAVARHEMVVAGTEPLVKELRTYRLKSTVATAVLVIDSVLMFFALAFLYSNPATDLASDDSQTDRQLDYGPPAASPEK